MTTQEQHIPTLRFSEFTGEWEDYELGDLLKITSASRVHKNEWTESGVPFFRSSDVVSYYKGLDNQKAYISLDLYRELSNKSGCVKKNDLLVTGGGSIGILYLVKTNEPLYFKDADLLWLKNSNRVNGYFLYTFFLTLSFRKYLSSITHTGTISHYTIVQAKSTPIKLPNNREQQKIASFLSSIDTKINQLSKKKTLLKQYKQGLMQKLFSQEIRLKNKQGNEYSSWGEVKLGEIAEFKRGKGISKSDIAEEGINKCIRYGELYTEYNETINDVISRTNVDKDKSILSKENDILMPTSDVTPSGLATASALSEKGIILGGDILIIRAEEIHNRYFCYYITFNKHEIMRLVSGVTVYHIYGSDLATLKMNIPPIKEQQKIADFLTVIDRKIELVDIGLEKAQSFKKGLLQQMFI